MKNNTLAYHSSTRHPTSGWSIGALTLGVLGWIVILLAPPLSSQSSTIARLFGFLVLISAFVAALGAVGSAAMALIVIRGSRVIAVIGGVAGAALLALLVIAHH